MPGTKSGGPVRSCANLIDHFKEDFEFLVITRDSDYCETKSYENIQSNAWNKIGNNVNVFYISNTNLNYQFLKKLVASTYFDVVYINGIYSKYFSILPVYLLRKSDKPVIIAARGMLNPQAFFVKPRRKKAFLSFMNLVSFYKNIIFHATNKDEANYIKKSIKESENIKIAPNLPRQVQRETLPEKDKQETTNFISVARVAQEKGTITALKAFSCLDSSHKIEYDIYGPIYDQDYWNKCKELIKKLPENIKITYKGSVSSEEVPLLLEAYHFFIMPSEGENYGHGIVEAFTAGCPVIISTKTPWKKLFNKKVGWDVDLQDSNALTEVLKTAVNMKNKVYKEWSRNAFLYSDEILKDQSVLLANRELFVTHL